MQLFFILFFDSFFTVISLTFTHIWISFMARKVQQPNDNILKIFYPSKLRVGKKSEKIITSSLIEGAFVSLFKFLGWAITQVIFP